MTDTERLQALDFVKNPNGQTLCKISLNSDELVELGENITHSSATSSIGLYDFISNSVGQKAKSKLFIKFQDYYLRLSASPNSKPIFTMRLSLPSSKFNEFLFSKLENAHYFKGFTQKDVIKLFEIAGRVQRAFLTDEQFEAIYKESIINPVKTEYQGNQIKGMSGDFRMSANEYWLLAHANIELAEPDNAYTSVSRSIEDNIAYFLELATCKEGSMRQGVSTLRDEIAINQEISTFSNLFNQLEEIDFNVKF